MYSERIEQLIKAALADGVLTEKEKQILLRRAQEEGIDLDEFGMVLDARITELQNAATEKAVKSTPKSNKLGEVRKCPVCGALAPALAVSCAECGYEFTGIEASSSTQKLAKLISDVSQKSLNRSAKDDAIYEAVNSFPIPNMKDDLFDLMMWLKNQGYRRKFNECIERAQYLYPNDPLFARIINEDKANDKKTTRQALVIIILLLPLLALLWFLGIL